MFENAVNYDKTNNVINDYIDIFCENLFFLIYF